MSEAAQQKLYLRDGMALLCEEVENEAYQELVCSKLLTQLKF